MKSSVVLLSLVVGSWAWAAEPASGRPSRSEGVIDPKADSVLRRMSDYVGGLKSFQVEAKTVDEKFTADGHKVQELQQSRVAVERPGELRVDRTSPAGHTSFVYDGKRFSVYNKDRNVYATAAAPPSLDAAIDDARERLQVEAPGGDLLVSNPYGSLTGGIVEGRYLGLEPIDGVMAHHIAVTTRDSDWQMWIKDGPEAVPLRYVITSKDLPGQPEFTLEMHNWQPNARLPEDSFSFSPPSGARRVDFVPAKAARKGE